VHRLVQAIIRHQLPPDQQQATAQRVVTLLAAASPGDPEDPVNWDTYAELAPHVLATAPLGDHLPAGRQLVLDTTRYLHVHGDIRASRAFREQLLDRWRKNLGPDHPDTLTVACSLIWTLTRLGQVKRARALGQDTLQRCHSFATPGTRASSCDRDYGVAACDLVPGQRDGLLVKDRAMSWYVVELGPSRCCRRSPGDPTVPAGPG
jgi:hypothetical protein